MRQALRHFNPRPPCGGRRLLFFFGLLPLLFQSTAPVWGPTSVSTQLPAKEPISIHGPRVGADQYFLFRRQGIHHFNPRPPCGGRQIIQTVKDAFTEFQSTAPVWGPTAPKYVFAVAAPISIHGPRVGADPTKTGRRWRQRNFNPRPPCGGRRRSGQYQIFRRDFNPRPPCGGRHGLGHMVTHPAGFQSTAPVWGPTMTTGSDTGSREFQSTAPVWGPTLQPAPSGADRQHFNPRPPCGGRLDRLHHAGRRRRFQSTAPVWGPTADPAPEGLCQQHFNPRPPCGGRLDLH